MKPVRVFRFLFCLCALSSLGACGLWEDDDIVAQTEPPQGLYEIPPVIPNPQTEIWRPGYWSLSSGEFEWMPGEVIARPTPTAVWKAAHWVRHNYGWTFEQGHWE